MNKKMMILLVLCASLLFSSAAVAEVYLPGTYSAEAQGFGGPVKVTLTVNENAITEALVEGEKETVGIGDQALPKLSEQLLAAQSAEIDGVAGATMTSKGVKAAAEMAITLAKGEIIAAVTWADGVYDGEDANGAGGKIAVKVTIEGGTIKDVKVTEQHETRGLGTTAMLKVIDAILKANSTEVDNITGATVSSNALKAAVNQALESAAK